MHSHLLEVKGSTMKSNLLNITDCAERERNCLDVYKNVENVYKKKLENDFHINGMHE